MSYKYHKLNSKVFILLFITLLFFSCSKNMEVQNMVQPKIQEIDRLSFGSIEEFQNAMAMICQGETKSNSIIKPRVNLFTKTSLIEVENDPILSYDLKNNYATKSADDLSVYEAAGYDELIPDKNLAGLLNANAEIEIANTIYKISPQGTYYFDKSFEKDFNANYSTFEETEGVVIDTMTVKLMDGIYRHNTFLVKDHFIYNAVDYFEEEEDSEEFEQATKAPTIISPLQYLDYNKYPRYCSDAETKIGQVFQSLFGRNKSFDYNFTNKKRFSSKFYYYDYIFWSSIGICTKTQKKSFLVWKEVPAEEIYVSWDNVITRTKLKGNILEYPSKAKAIALKNQEYNQTLKKSEDVFYVFGFSVSQSDIDKAIGQGIKSLLTAIKSKTGTDVSAADKICVVGPTHYYVVFPSNGYNVFNKAKLDKVFYKEFSLGITFDVLNLPKDWASWVISILKTTYELPNVELYKGEARTAVNFEGQIGAMSIYKK